MKRLILIAMLALALAGCGSDEAASPREVTAPPPADRPSLPARVVTATGKPAVAPFSVELSGPARVTPGVAFELAASVRSSTRVEGIRVAIEVPEGARLEAGAERVVVTTAPGAPVKYRLSVAGAGYYRFVVFARRDRQGAVAVFEVGERRAAKPAARRVLRTRDGRKVME